MFLKFCTYILLVVFCLLPRMECFSPTVHVINITLSNAGTGWPTTEATLGSLNDTVTSTMCGQLPSGLVCNAILTLVDTAVLALNVRAEAQSTTNGYAVYQTMSGWASNTNIPLSTLVANCQTSLGVTVSTLAYTAGTYTVPCRGENTFTFLPSCATNETPTVTFYVRNSGGSIPNVINNYLCGSTTCTGVSVAVSTTGTLTTASVSGSASGLEAFLYYVASVRAASSLPSSSLTSAVGSASAGVSADSIQLTSGGLNATVFSLKENDRYQQYYNIPMNCSAESGYWAFALIAIPIIAVLVFWYIWHRARHTAKKHMRRLIIQDEERIMQGYSSALNLGGGVPDAAGGASNVEQSPATAAATQWYVDANGNYYEVPVDDGQTGGSGGGVDAYGNTSQQQEYQYYVDPTTGETYQVPATQGGSYDQAAGAAENGGGDATALQEGGGMDANAASEQQYQYYVDPNTGETYQVAAEPSAGYDTDGATQLQNGADDAGNDVVVDPNDGAVDYNSYYQQNDSVNGGADAENVMDQEMNEANLYSGDQYVDPNAGLEGQEGAEAYADPNAEAQEYYVDPETGAYYAVIVDPNTGETYYQPVETETAAQ